MFYRLNPAIGVFCLSMAMTLFMCSDKYEESILINLPDNVTIVMVYISPGSFMMGSDETEVGHEPDELPVHRVTINYGFYIGKTEITQAQWLAVMGSWPDSINQPNQKEGLGDQYPAYFVSWEDCQHFINALNEHIKSTEQTIHNMRLPSEAEWEYACRAGSTSRFYFGDSLTGINGKTAEDYMWYRENNSPEGTKPVGQKLPNAWGLYDMHGNVWEWCQDWYHENYEGAPVDGSPWEDPPGLYRILHGGDWDNKAKACRSANRNDHRSPGDRSADLGFRIVLTANND